MVYIYTKGDQIYLVVFSRSGFMVQNNCNIKMCSLHSILPSNRIPVGNTTDMFTRCILTCEDFIASYFIVQVQCCLTDDVHILVKSISNSTVHRYKVLT